MRNKYQEQAAYMKVKICSTVISAFIIWPCEAHAQQITDISNFPQYTSSKQCDFFNSVTMHDPVLFESCKKLDSEKKDLLQIHWDDVPVEVRRECIKRNDLARAVEGYTSLASCVVEGVGLMWLNGKLKITRHD